MTFSIYAAGTKEQVKAQVAHQREGHANYNNDLTQFDAVHSLIKHHLDNSDYPGGVHVEASGHHDTYSGNLDLKIRTLNIPSAPADDAETEA